MNSRTLSNWTCLRVAAIAITLIAFPLLGSTVGADDSASVDVTAEISGQIQLSLEVCDSSADFGTGLNSLGSVPTSSDFVTATSEGTSGFQGVFYIWSPSCGSGEVPLITVESSDPWFIKPCASLMGDSTSSLSIDDLFHRRLNATTPTTYTDAFQQGTPFASCTSATFNGPFNASYLEWETQYFLKVDDNETQGTFHATTTWEVSN